MKDLNKEHLVEDQWHFPIMTKFGFKTTDKSKKGLVRTYVYVKDNNSIIVTTGANSDNWKDEKNNKFGYWGSLENYIKNL